MFGARVTDAVDAAELDEKQGRPNPTLDRSVGKPHGEQLLAGRKALLPGRNGRNPAYRPILGSHTDP